MHNCFIIDNSLPLEQKCTLGISYLDYIKMNIQILIKELVKAGFYQSRNYIMHLYVTSNPNEHLSSYEHDKTHFDYQLKSIESRALTYPAETLRTALKQIGKFRILTETETILGYRDTTIYEPALILFFSSKMSERKIDKMEKLLGRYQMRSEYQFIHYRLSLPLKIQRGLTNIQAMRKELQASQQYLKLTEFSYNLSRGEVRIISQTTGKECLCENLLSLLNNYCPALCVDFNLFQLTQNPQPDLLVNTELPALNAKWDGKLTKIKLLTPSSRKNRNLIPFPQQIKVSQQNYQYSISQFTIPQFYVDFSYKLSYSEAELILTRIPFDHYYIPASKQNSENTTQFYKNLANNQRILSQAKITKIHFPIWMKKDQKYILIGLLCFNSGEFCQLLITYPHFLNLCRVLMILENRKNYNDQKRAEIMLKQYLNSIPNYYIIFIKHFFEHNFGIQIPLDPRKNAVQLSIQKKIKVSKMSERNKIQILRQQNSKNHQMNMAICCPIYNDLESYKQYSKFISKSYQDTDISTKTFKGFLQKIDDFHKTFSINTYFSFRNVQKLTPVTRQLEKNKNQIDEFNIGFNTGTKRRKRDEPDLSRFSEDTPFPEQKLEMRQLNIMEIEKTLIQNKKAVQMTNQIIYTKQQSQDTNKTMQIERSSESESKGVWQILEVANKIQVKHLKKMVINPQNINNSLFVKNRNILENFKNKNHQK